MVVMINLNLGHKLFIINSDGDMSLVSPKYLMLMLVCNKVSRAWWRLWEVEIPWRETNFFSFWFFGFGLTETETATVQIRNAHTAAANQEKRPKKKQHVHLCSHTHKHTNALSTDWEDSNSFKSTLVQHFAVFSNWTCFFCFFYFKDFFGPELERLSEICFYLKSADGISPVWILVLPWFSIRQTLGIHIQIEDGIVFWVVDLGLEQFHDVEESLKRSTEVNDCREGGEDFYTVRSVFLWFSLPIIFVVKFQCFNICLL